MIETMSLVLTLCSPPRLCVCLCVPVRRQVFAREACETHARNREIHTRSTSGAHYTSCTARTWPFFVRGSSVSFQQFPEPFYAQICVSQDASQGLWMENLPCMPRYGYPIALFVPVDLMAPTLACEQEPCTFHRFDDFIRCNSRQPFTHTVTSKEVRLTASSWGISSPISNRSST